MRLREREVDIEARKHFKDKVYKTVVPRNVRLSEAPSHGMPCLIYDKNCSGSKSYISLAEEFIDQGNQPMGSAAWTQQKKVLEEDCQPYSAILKKNQNEGRGSQKFHIAPKFI